MSSILCIGELLIDWFPPEPGVSLEQAETLLKKPGGAPANVAVIASVLGGDAGLVSVVGADPFGRYLRNVVAGYGVDVTLVRETQDAATAMAFVARLSDGGRDFVFVHGADHQWLWDDAVDRAADQAVIVHFGAATLQVSEEVRVQYADAAVRLRKADQRCICFDPNYRSDLWCGKEADWRAWTIGMIGSSHIVKMSDEELLLVTGTDAIGPALDEAVKLTEICLRQELAAPVLLITCGGDGVWIVWAENGEVSRLLVATVPLAGPLIDTTGAGDAFVGAFLHQVAAAENWRACLADGQWLAAAASGANEVAGWICCQMGAMPNRQTWPGRVNG